MFEVVFEVIIYKEERRKANLANLELEHVWLIMEDHKT